VAGSRRGASYAQRIAALDDLLPAAHPFRQSAQVAVPRTALCQISYRPVAGLQETSTSAITTTRRLAPTFTADRARMPRALTAAQESYAAISTLTHATAP
jgi:hypothetical protein